MIYPIAVILIVASLDTVKSEIQWKTVELNDAYEGSQQQSGIPHSFERTAIQFKTDNNDDDASQSLDVDFFVEKERQGGLTVNFPSAGSGSGPDNYLIKHCKNKESTFPENMPTEAEKLWSIFATTGANPSFKVQVNGVEVINVLLTDDTCDYPNWRNFWTQEIGLLRFNSWQSVFVGYHLDSCYWGHYLDADADCQECPADHWSADAGDTACTPCPVGTHVGVGLGLAESDCTENGDETDGDETDGDETDGDETDGDETDGDETDGDETDSEHNYSQSVAHKLSVLLVVLLFASNMNI
ncbi:uncharacterized protein LOC134822349 [Bolinopsis microptera]|uniref:uncharacterized protein LOC134822349 n=1 Tax=Bolinopsis microptera TaxID=2820187 RepID=UPI003079DF41